MKAKNIPFGKIILGLWIIFSAAYIANGEYNRIQNFIIKQAYNNGVADAVAQVINQAKNCQPFPVNVGEAKVNLISVECLKQANEKQEE